MKLKNPLNLRRLLSKEVAFADNSRHYGFYIDGDIAKLPGGGRRGAAVLCELLPDQLAQVTHSYQLIRLMVLDKTYIISRTYFRKDFLLYSSEYFFYTNIVVSNIPIFVETQIYNLLIKSVVYYE